MRRNRFGLPGRAWIDGGLLLLFCGLLVSLWGCGGSSPMIAPAGETASHAGPRASAEAKHAETKKEAPDDRLRPPLNVPADTLPDGGLSPVVGGPRSSLAREEKEPKKPEAPQVWHRDAQRPTFARVYVGDGNALELVSLHVTVTVEGSRARTLVDHVFRNPHDKQLEGTFEYPLPTGASPSYFAMFLGQTRTTPPARWAGGGGAPALPPDTLARLTPAEVVKQVNTADWGPLQVAHVVAKEKALETYEEVVRGKVDPALLEYSGGNTFSGRVFPIPAKGYNRVLIAYEELLPLAREQAVYRYALPDCKLQELKFTLSASGAECKDPAFLPKDAKKAEGGNFLSYSKTWTETGPGGDAIFAFRPPNAQVQAISGRQGDNGPRYLYARIRPELKIQKAAPFAEDAVFLLDTSLSESPDRFAVSMKLLRKILEDDAEIHRFNVLTFSVGSAWLEPRGMMDNTPANRDKVFERLDGLLLEGATDVSAALDHLLRPDFEMRPGTPLNVFLLSDGQMTWGESDAAALVARFETRCPFPTRFHCYRTGLGADNVELFEALTRKGGGIFNCYGEADLTACAAAHRSQCLQIQSVKVNGTDVRDVLVAGRKAAVYPGGDLIVAARVGEAGPATLVVEGTFLGEKFAQEYRVDVGSSSELAPRGWGEIAVASLQALNDARFDPVVIAYCQQFGIASRLASFLVLENESDYKRLDLEKERGRTITGDLGTFLDTAWQSLGRVIGAKDSFARLLEQAEAQIKLKSSAEAVYVNRLLALLTDKDFDVPADDLTGALVRREDVPHAYLEGMAKDRRDITTYLTEARRRADERDVSGAVRALSNVIEVYPERTDALRLVGYRLLDLHQPGQAARLFRQVQGQRPFEPHSYRDMARALELNNRYGLAALQYEIVLAGTWHNRFRDSLKQVSREEYAQMIQQAVHEKAVSPDLLNYFDNRLKQLSGSVPKGDLRVSMSWNTDGTDVDLWVIEPNGEKCFYSHNRTKSGGELSQDQTQGYGPERYQVAKALKGEYRIIAHYYSPNRNLLGGETHVNVVVTRFAGTPQETVERHTVILKRQDEQAEVCRVKY